MSKTRYEDCDFFNWKNWIRLGEQCIRINKCMIIEQFIVRKWRVFSRFFNYEILLHGPTIKNLDPKVIRISRLSAFLSWIFCITAPAICSCFASSSNLERTTGGMCVERSEKDSNDDKDEADSLALPRKRRFLLTHVEMLTASWLCINSAPSLNVSDYYNYYNCNNPHWTEPIRVYQALKLRHIMFSLYFHSGNSSWMHGDSTGIKDVTNTIIKWKTKPSMCKSVVDRKLEAVDDGLDVLFE